MYVVKIFCVLLYLGVWQNVVDSTNWVDNLVKNILDRSRFRQLRLMTSFDENEHLENPFVNELIVKLMYDLPTVRINYGKKFEIPGNVEPSHGAYNHFPIDTTATLFLLVIESNGNLPITKTKKFIDAVAEMASYHYSPKYLIIISVRIRSNSLEELLEYAWNQRMLSFTILEFSEQNEIFDRSAIIQRLNPLKRKYTGTSLTGKNDDRSALPIIHQLNQFKKEYTITNWTGGVHELFPNKISNMYGHFLRVRAVNVPPFSIAKFDDNGKPNEVKGSNAKVIKIIAKQLNASIKWIPPARDENLYNINDPFRGAYSLMELQKIDIEAYLAPQYSITMNNSLRTTAVLMDQFCAIVPISYRSQVSFPTNICKAYLLSIALVTTFWLLSRLLRFNDFYWKMFIIGRVLFFVPVRKSPKANTERIIFVCLFATSGIISTKIFASFTDISMETAHQTEFNTFEDLDNSGLTPVISPILYNKTFASARGALFNLKKKAVLSVRPRDCPAIAAKYKNVTCCLGKLGVDLKAGNKNNRTELKVAQPCFWYDATAFTIGKRSPYRSHINYIIWNLHSGGVLRFLYDGGKPLKWTLTRHDAILQQIHSSKTLRSLLLAISCIGFTISILVLLAEILIHYKTKVFSLFGVFRFEKNGQ